jgi:hypothetical protein
MTPFPGDHRRPQPPRFILARPPLTASPVNTEGVSTMDFARDRQENDRGQQHPERVQNGGHVDPWHGGLQPCCQACVHHSLGQEGQAQQGCHHAPEIVGCPAQIGYPSTPVPVAGQHIRYPCLLHVPASIALPIYTQPALPHFHALQTYTNHHVSQAPGQGVQVPPAQLSNNPITTPSPSLPVQVQGCCHNLACVDHQHVTSIKPPVGQNQAACSRPHLDKCGIARRSTTPLGELPHQHGQHSDWHRPTLRPPLSPPSENERRTRSRSTKSLRHEHRFTSPLPHPDHYSLSKHSDTTSTSPSHSRGCLKCRCNPKCLCLCHTPDLISPFRLPPPQGLRRAPPLHNLQNTQTPNRDIRVRVHYPPGPELHHVVPHPVLNRAHSPYPSGPSQRVGASSSVSGSS